MLCPATRDPVGSLNLIYGLSRKPGVELILAVDPGNVGLGLNPAHQTSRSRVVVWLGLD